MNIRSLTLEQVEAMSYVDFISILNETNRPPGGKKTIRTILKNSFLDRDSSVLEIGSNTGFSSIEIACIAKCKVFGIDVNSKSVEIANENAKLNLVSDKVQFQTGNIESIDFKSDSFDLIMAGGTMAWVKNKDEAMRQCLRILKPWGFLAVVPFFYHTRPPAKLLNELNNSLNIDIEPWRKEFWIDFFVKSGLEIYFEKVRIIKPVSNEKITDFLKDLLEPLKGKVDKSTYDAMLNKGKYYYNLFNENHQYLSYGIYLLRNRPIKEQLELF